MKLALPDVALGFAVPSGAPVAIPIRNMAVVGQTQESGKTTTLEALIHRAGIRAVTFLTKRGEGAFEGAWRVAPYFREQADWQFVASVLEASRGEKLKFERAWIIRASRGAQTLADVHRNVRAALADKKIRGLSADVYLTLDAYLTEVVPALACYRWAAALDLAPGINVVDLIGMPLNLQHLVIKSSLDWVRDRETAAVTVIPEAWKFVPEGRNTPVKLAVHSLIRQGSGLRNYVWLDSQDIGGVDKETLRSVPVWLLGVQREANEIKRTLDNIPEGVSKPSKADIATLELGQFYACWGKHAIKTYVQPTWMDADVARGVAVGEIPLAGIVHVRHGVGILMEEGVVTEAEARALRDENQQLRTMNVELQTRLEALERKDGHDQQAGRTAKSRGHEAVPAHRSVPPSRLPRSRPTAEPGDQGPTGETADAAPRVFTAEETFDNERLYQAFKARLIEDAVSDPKFLRVLATQSELEVRVERKTVSIDGKSLKGRLARMIADGFYADGQTQGATRARLKQTGPDVNQGNLWRALQDFVSDGFLTISGGGDYRAVEKMKIRIVESAA